jgi:hypothetical protein
MKGRLPNIALPPPQSAGQDIHAPTNDPVSVLQNENPGCIPQEKHCKIAIYAIPVVSAGIEALQTLFDLDGKPAYFAYPVTLINALSAYGINKRFDVDGIEDTYQILKNRKIPAEWRPLSFGDEIAASVISAPLALYSAFASAAISYVFVLELPAKHAFTQSINMAGWKILSGTAGAFTCLGILSGEGMATYKKTRDIIAGVNSEYSNTFSSYVSPGLGGLLGVFSSTNDAIATFGGMRYVFDITSPLGLATLGAASIVNGVTDYSTNGIFVIECLDEFFGSFTSEENNHKNPKVISALTLSLAAGTLLAYAWHGLAKEALMESLEVLGVDLPSVTVPLVQALACGGATSTLINTAGNVYPWFYAAADKLSGALSSIYNRIANSQCCQRQTPIEDEFFAEFNQPDAVVIDIDALPNSDEENPSTPSAYRLFSPSYDSDATTDTQATKFNKQLRFF